jgi:hypothetical protein
MVDYTMPIVFGPYEISVGPAMLEGKELLVYIVKNTETGVVEAETSSLPRAILSTQSSAIALEQLLSSRDLHSIEDLAALEHGLDMADNGQTH